ncbi:hypothetical protein ACFX1T_021491 [Malus domestica]
MSSSFTVQRSLPPSRALHHPDQSPFTKAANFAQIPSWLSLKSTATSIDTCQIELGQVENVHLVSLSKQGKLRGARHFLEQMNDAGVSVSPHSYKCFNPPEFLENDDLQMYCDCGVYRLHRMRCFKGIWFLGL